MAAMDTSFIRQATAADLAGLLRIAADVGAWHEGGYFERCLSEQQTEKRVILVAESGDALMGYAQLVWSPEYPPFKRLGIPEIQDLNVVPLVRRQGLGGRLVAACEELVRMSCKQEIGIAVGLDSSFGAAQRLYVKKGYVPDGAGVCYDDVPSRAGELRPVDGQLTLKFIKTL